MEIKRISVIMPVFNGERYIRAAIESVRAQTYPVSQLICVNDGSTDGTRTILQDLGTSITHIDTGENLGIGGARNAGLKEATGEYIAFLDADDVWLPKKLETQMRAFDTKPEIEALFCNMECFISPDIPEGDQAALYCPPGAQPAYIPSAFIIRAESFYRVGLFEPKWRVGEFIDWFARAKAVGLTYETLSDVLLQRRIHTNNVGVTARSSRADYLRILKESLDKRKEK